MVLRIAVLKVIRGCKNSGIYGFLGTSWVLITMGPRNSTPTVVLTFTAGRKRSITPLPRSPPAQAAAMSLRQKRGRHEQNKKRAVYIRRALPTSSLLKTDARSENLHGIFIGTPAIITSHPSKYRDGARRVFTDQAGSACTTREAP